MEGQIQLQTTYHMVIRLVEHRPILVYPRHNPPASSSQNKQINLESGNHQKGDDRPVASKNYKKTREFVTAIDRTNRETGKEQKNFNDNYPEAPLLTHKLSLSKTEQIKLFKNDLVNQLNRITKEREAESTCPRKYHRLQSLHLIETCSMTESQSYDFDDNQSQIMELTQEQKQFFNNFIQQSPVKCYQFEPKHITALELIPAISTSNKKDNETPSYPANKSKVIRNFFKPKLIQSSTMKDQKTCISSHTCTDSLMMRSKLKEESPDKRERCFQSYIFS